MYKKCARLLEMAGFCRLSIKARIWLSFAVLGGLILAIGLDIHYSQKQMDSSVRHLIGKAYPLMEASLRLDIQLQKVSSSMGYYLLTLEKSHRKNTEYYLRGMKETLGLLERRMSQWNHDDARKSIDRIRHGLRKLEYHKQRLFSLVEKRHEKYPVLVVSNKQLNPLVKAVAHSLTVLAETLYEEVMQVDQGVSTEGGLGTREIERKLALLRDVYELRRDWFYVVINYSSYLSYRSRNNISNIEIYRSRINTLLEKIKAQRPVLGLEARHEVDKIESGLNQYFSIASRMIKLHSSKKWRTDLYQTNNQVTPLYNKIDAVLGEFNADLRSIIDLGSASLLKRMRQHSRRGLALVLLGVVIAFVIVVLLVITVLNRLDRTVSAMSEIADGGGDLSHRLDESGYDELSSLAKAYNRFVQKIEGVVELTIKSSYTLAQESQSLSLYTQETEQGVTAQAQETRRIAESIRTISAKIGEIAENATSAAESAADSRDKAQQGKVVVANTVSMIHELADDVGQAAESIQLLQAEGGRIGSVLGVINEIADQTNLLALNAAIEAARAGEHGRGFAVVADEVRSLAQKTRSETVRIQDQVEALLAGIAAAADKMMQSNCKSKQSVESARQTGAVLESISDAVVSIAGLNHKIASATNEQASVAREIDSNVTTITGIGEQVAANATRTARSSAELSIMADQLRGLIRQFLLSKANDDQGSVQDSSETPQSGGNDVELF